MPRARKRSADMAGAVGLGGKRGAWGNTAGGSDIEDELLRPLAEFPQPAEMDLSDELPEAWGPEAEWPVLVSKIETVAGALVGTAARASDQQRALRSKVLGLKKGVQAIAFKRPILVTSKKKVATLLPNFDKIENQICEI